MMKVPDLEDMIQQQVKHGYVCQGCFKFLTEHHLYLDPVGHEVFICCYLNDSMVQQAVEPSVLHRFDPLPKRLASIDGKEYRGIDYSKIVNTLNTMLPRIFQVPLPDGIIFTDDYGKASYYYTTLPDI